MCQVTFRNKYFGTLHPSFWGNILLGNEEERIMEAAKLWSILFLLLFYVRTKALLSKPAVLPTLIWYIHEKKKIFSEWANMHRFISAPKTSNENQQCLTQAVLAVFASFRSLSHVAQTEISFLCADQLLSFDLSNTAWQLCLLHIKHQENFCCTLDCLTV